MKIWDSVYISLFGSANLLKIKKIKTKMFRELFQPQSRNNFDSYFKENREHIFIQELPLFLPKEGSVQIEIRRGKMAEI